MVIKYYNGYIKRQKLIEMTKTTKDGTTAFHIKEALIELGFSAKGVFCKLEDITKENIILPCIANVIINNSYKHFIVIYEINYKNKYLVIGDPADKIKKIKFMEFNKIFNNVLIIFYPIKKLEINKDIKEFNFIIELLRPHKKLLLNIIILSIFITIFSIYTSFYTGYMINSIVNNSKSYLLFIFCLFFPIYILKILSNYFRNILLSYINQKLDLGLTIDIFNKIVDLPYHYYRNKTTGDMVSRINDLEVIRDMISKVFLSIFIDLPLAFLSLIILYIINKTLFIIGFIIIILYFIIVILFRGFFNDYIKKIKVKKSDAYSYMIEAISGFETVKGIHLEGKIKDNFEKKYVRLLKNIFKYQNLYFIQNLFKDIINDFGFILIIFIGCLFVIENKLSIGTLLTFSSLLTYFLEPIKNIINLDSIIKESKISLKRILDLVSYEKDKDGIFDDFLAGDINVSNLTFSFNDRDNILKNVNLKLNKGTKTMVIGKSGSGKSTLFKLMMKYYKVANNKIFINNIDINNLKKEVIDKNILYLGQNEILFNDTLYNNLMVDNNEESKILNISRMCYIEEIMDPNLGYNMLIEENGFNLSGGERQRIMLARTLLRNFNILIIDEGLNQVDINLERNILKNMFKYYEDKTIIVVSHRLDNKDLFDNIIKIESGVCKLENG